MKSLPDIVKGFGSWIVQFSRYLFSEFMGFLRRNKYGVMGTIAFHMVLIIILLSFKLNTRREFTEAEIFIDIPPEVAEQILKEEQEKIEKVLEEKNSEISESVEELLRSIAVNRNIKKSSSDPKQNVDKMIEEIRRNLDEYSSDDAPVGGGNDLSEFKKDSLTAAQEKEKQRMLDSLESVEYSGPSSVYYSLEGRHKVYLPIPVFKCEGEGKIVVQIVVNRGGRVLDAKVLKRESVQDDCLFEAALQASRKTRFNVSTKSPERQTGTITYHFVKQ